MSRHEDRPAQDRRPRRTPRRPAPSVLPLVAIVGAPNVGKSRLFNRLTGGRSIVLDRPGVTRDRLEGICEWGGRRFRVLDTGGWIPETRDELTQGVESQVLQGIAGASLLLFLVDGRIGLTPLDRSLSLFFRKTGRPLLLVVNKVDAETQEGRLLDFLALGFPDPLPVSAEEGRGVGTLLDRVLESLPESSRTPAPRTAGGGRMRLALVGRPNVGKSTLFNLLIGEERALVGSLPGTTRDPVDAEFLHDGVLYRIVDTAGLRKRSRIGGEEVESESVRRALESLKRADLVIVLLDAGEIASHQDLAVVGACQKLRRPFLIALNKIDLLPPTDERRARVEREARERLRFAEEPPVVRISALRGNGIGRLLGILARMARETNRRVPTPELNRALETALERRSPPSTGRAARLYYITQTGGPPPSFVVFTNGAAIGAPYRRFLARHLREALGFTCVPVSLRFKRKSSRGRGRTAGRR